MAKKTNATPKPKVRRKSQSKTKDPYYQREQSKYNSPVPSREHILDTMRDIAHPVVADDLFEYFKLSTEDELEGVTRRLAAMRRDGQLMQDREGRYALVDDCDLLAGWVQSTKDGFGFLIRDDGGNDVFLPARQVRQVFSEDRVLVRLMSSRRSKKLEGVIVRVIERNTHQVVGRLFKESGVVFVVPYDRKIHQDILISGPITKKAKAGDYVTVSIEEQPTSRRQAVGAITSVMGDALTPGLEVELAIAAHALPNKWNKEVKQHVTTIPKKVSAAECKGRLDLRDLPFVTIDGEDAKDYDDAVFCEKQKTGWRLAVAIADVGHYVKIDDPIDLEARHRGTSVYFPGRVIPMLPEALSNTMCSLLPHQDRLVFVVDMQINRSGECTQATFHDAVIHSHARLTYDQVRDDLAAQKSDYPELLPMLQEAFNCYQALWREREQRGALDFDTQETSIVFDEGQRIKYIEPKYRHDIHRLIESFMLVTNAEVARYLLKHKIPALYREHLPPEPDKVQILSDFLRAMGLRLTAKEGVPTAKNFSRLLNRIRERDDAHIIQMVLLRSLKQAVYTPKHTGHFGLAYDHYCQFTSPIRRYPDLVAHRALRHALKAKKQTKTLYKTDDLHTLGETLSLAERRADIASRDVTDWLKCHYMRDKQGQNFAGSITKVTGFGLFIELNDVYVEGLCHITALPEDYYHFDQLMYVLRGKHAGREYRMGDQVQVKVVRVDLDQRKIDFIIEENTPKRKPKPKKKSKHSSKRKPKGATGKKKAKP